MHVFQLNLNPESASACADRLIKVCENLQALVDLKPVLPLITADGVVAAAVTGAPPSNCVSRVEAMMAGGLAGLRAFLHLANEASHLAAAGFNPTSPNTLVEPTIDAEGKSPVELAMARHKALFEFKAAEGIGPTVWARAHTQSFITELELVEALLKASGAVADRSLLFWYDPGLTQKERDNNADIALRLGMTLIPRSEAPRDALREAYTKLEAIAAGS